MSNTKAKFELTWIGKDKRPRLDPRILKWFKPVSGQFQIIYKQGVEHREYQPDFVAELGGEVLLVETKARADLNDPVVQAKAEAARAWCENASDHLVKNGGKSWRYLLIPHDEVVENRQLKDYR